MREQAAIKRLVVIIIIVIITLSAMQSAMKGPLF